MAGDFVAHQLITKGGEGSNSIPDIPLPLLKQMTKEGHSVLLSSAAKACQTQDTLSEFIDHLVKALERKGIIGTEEVCCPEKPLSG